MQSISTQIGVGGGFLSLREGWRTSYKYSGRAGQLLYW